MAEKAAKEDPNGYFADQFRNKYNTLGHLTETAKEIDVQMKGKLDVFVMGAGTGATINGVSHYFKNKKMEVTIVLADPTGSSLYNWARFGTFFTHEEKEQAKGKSRRY